MECPSHAARAIEEACEANGIHVPPDQGFSLHSVCDCDPRAMKCLDALQRDSTWDKLKPEHMFTKMEDAVVPTALEEMQQMVASQRGSGDKDGWPFIRSLMKTAHARHCPSDAFHVPSAWSRVRCIWHDKP